MKCLLSIGEVILSQNTYFSRSIVTNAVSEMQKTDHHYVLSPSDIKKLKWVRPAAQIAVLTDPVHVEGGKGYVPTEGLNGRSNTGPS